MWHDPHGQLKAGGALIVDTVDQARSAMAKAKSVPRVTIVRQSSADAVARLAVELKNVTLGLDELDLVCNGKHWTSDAVHSIVHYGRHIGVSLLGGFRRTVNVQEDILSQADYVWIFKHSASAEPDFRALQRRFGSAVAEAAQRLEPFQFIPWVDT